MKPFPIVLITGASSGIGKSIGIYLTQKGCKVYGTSGMQKITKNLKALAYLALMFQGQKPFRRL